MFLMPKHHMLKKIRVEGLTFPDFKTHLQATIIMA